MIAETPCYDPAAEMHWKRIAALGVMGGTLVTLLARASTSVAPAPRAAPTDAAPSPTAPIFPEVERLRARLRAPIAPAAPSRNLFAFTRAARRPSQVAAAPPAELTAPMTVTPPATRTPSLAFVGLAEDPGPDGPLRTAILSGGRELHFAKPGDVVGAYRVAAIGADALELIALDDGSSFVLTLK